MASDVETAGIDAEKSAVRRWLTRFVDDHFLLVTLGVPLLVLGVVFAYPLVWVLSQSLWVNTPWKAHQFDPLYNYEVILSADFAAGMSRTLLYAFGSFSLSFSGGLLIALALNRVRPQWLRTTYLTAFTFVLAVPVSVAAMLWGALLSDREAALANWLLLELGLLEEPMAFLQTEALALPIVTLIDAWIRMPLAVLVFLAGRRAIPTRFYEAARVDGASTVQTFKHVTLPHLRPYMATVVLLIWASAFQAFSVIWVTTGGGPGRHTRTASVLLYDVSILYLNFGRGAAISTVLVAITLLLTAGYVRYFMNT